MLIFSFLYSQSKLIDDKFFSTSLDTTRDLRVYLPDGYDSLNADIRYPVIYFLHGGGGDQTSYQLIIPILDSLISNKIIDPVIVVKPDGNCKPYLNSKWMNSELYGNFEDFIVNDLVNYIDSKYQTIVLKGGRSIMGHSGGGEGAMRIALKHPDVYSGIASHSAILAPEFGKFIFPLILAENDSSDTIKPTAGFLSLVLFTAAGGYSPNMNKPPYFVDLPINKNGELIDSVWARWSLNSPVHLASEYSLEANLKIYLDCGTNDPIFEYTTVFTDTLASLNIPFEFQSYVGGHNDKLGERFPISLVFLNSVMNSTILSH